MLDTLTPDYIPQDYISGWAFVEKETAPPTAIFVELNGLDSPQRYIFRAWRTVRPDVAQHFGSDALLGSGFRCVVDAPKGSYAISVIQERLAQHTINRFSEVLTLPGRDE